MKIAGKYFYGNEVSAYGQEHNRLDYATLAKAFDAVLNNDIMSATEGAGLGYWEQVSGMVDNQDEIDELQEQADELEEEVEALDDQKDEEEAEDEPDAEKVNALQAEIDEKQGKLDKLQERIDELQEEQDYPDEVFQWYIVDDQGADILQEINEVVYYNDALNMYLWGVTHWGTSWDYVLTDVKINQGYEG